MTHGRWVMLAAGVTGLAGVVLAALGAHAVPGMDEPSNYRAWQSASTLHLAHSLLLLVLGMRLQQTPSSWLLLGAGMLLMGVVLFSGSIYARVAMGLDGTFNLAPAGGLFLMAPWVVVTVGLLRD